MKNMHIFIMILTVFSFMIIPLTVYADDSDFMIEGYNLDTVEYDCRIDCFSDDESYLGTYVSYYKACLNTHPSSRGYLWCICLKNYAGVYLMYSNDSDIEPVDNGLFYVNASDVGSTLESITNKPELTTSNCIKSTLFSPIYLNQDKYCRDNCCYKFDVIVNSTLPVYYKTFNSEEEYNDWFNSSGYNLSINPNQDYGTNGFSPDGDYDNGEDYDLEVPKDLKCKGFDSSTIVSSLKDDKVLTWKQSDNIDVKDWYTEIYLREVGTFKRFIWSSKEPFDSGYTKQWNLYANVLNAKRKYTFKFDDIKAYPCTPNGEDIGGISQITDYYVKMRNTYFDETTKRMHYSNWITWHIDDKGNVDCVENEDHDVTNTDKDDVKIDSDNYKPGEDYTNKNKDTTSDSFTLDSFLSYLRQAVDTVGEVPTMLGTVFSWLPAVFTSMIVCGIGLLVLLRILNR